MDFLSINNNYYNGLMENTTNGMVTKKLTDSVKRAENTTDDEELMKACKSFESYMVEQNLSSAIFRKIGYLKIILQII